MRLAVAGELIAAEREGKRAEPRIVRRIGETVSAGRQQAGQRAGPEQVLGRIVSLFQTEQNAGELACVVRHDEMLAGLRLKTRRLHENQLARVENFRRLGEILGGDEQNRHRLLVGLHEDRMHDYSAAFRSDGFGT